MRSETNVDTITTELTLLDVLPVQIERKWKSGTVKFSTLAVESTRLESQGGSGQVTDSSSTLRDHVASIGMKQEDSGALPPIIIHTLSVSSSASPDPSTCTTSISALIELKLDGAE
ncbi:hypothetical protein Dimus_018588 [Dionaea muscipula]